MVREQGKSASQSRTRSRGCKPLAKAFFSFGMCVAGAMSAAAQGAASEPPELSEGGTTPLSITPTAENDGVSAGSSSLGLQRLGETGPQPARLGSDASNLRLTIDLSSRFIVNTDRGETAAENFIGFDYHQVFTGDSGDWGTLLLQGYLTRIDNQPMAAPFFEGDDDWEFVFRIFNFNYTGLAQGKFNLRVGHFEVPFGLEHVINTNGTLRDFTSGRNLGVKADWGVSVNGILGDLDYEVGLTRGTGNEWHTNDDSYAVAGRLGKKISHSFSIGLSGFYGEVLSPSPAFRTIRRTRAGADASFLFGPFTLLGEFSIGQTQDMDVINGLLELDWQNPEETLLVYVQCRSFNQESAGDWEHAIAVAFGCRYAIDNHWALSVQWTQDFDTFTGVARAGVLGVQARYRF